MKMCHPVLHGFVCEYCTSIIYEIHELINLNDISSLVYTRAFVQFSDYSI